VVAARQFDVRRVASQSADGRPALAVVLQDDTLKHLSTRVVAPLVEVLDDFRIEHLTPAVRIDGVEYLVAVHLVATVPLTSLGALVATLKDEERSLKRAIDLVFFGV
jgi:hypothetical protein